MPLWLRAPWSRASCIPLISRALAWIFAMVVLAVDTSFPDAPPSTTPPHQSSDFRQLGRRGVKGLLAVPISFVSEHIETLEEIDMEYRELAEESGIWNWGRVPALNTNAAFIDDLADAVLEALPYVGCLAGPTDSLVPLGGLIRRYIFRVVGNEVRCRGQQNNRRKSKQERNLLYLLYETV